MTIKTKRERHIRAHGIRPGDQVFMDRKWWVVERPVVSGEVIKWTDKDGDKESTVADIGEHADKVVRLLVKRGSHKTIMLAGCNAVVKILRG